jgi:sugar/nucleoside kinase (ribokinase family)
MKGWESREIYSPVFRVPSVAGTTGAGDSTIAGFLASVFKGLGPVDSLTMAVAVGGCCVEAADATSGVMAWEETQGRVRRGWERAASPVAEKGWGKGADGLWHGPGDGRGAY